MVVPVLRVNSRVSMRRGTPVGRLCASACSLGALAVWRIMGALLLLLWLAGCGAAGVAKLAYKQAPELAYVWLDGYADFDGAQSLRIKADLEALHQWHRQTQLPLYARSLGQLQKTFAADVSAGQVCSVVKEARANVSAVLAQAEGPMTNLAASLQASQLQTMARKFERGNADWRSDFPASAPQKIVDKRFRQARDRAEMLYGSLSDSQQQALRRSMGSSVFNPAVAYAERVRRQQDTLQTLQRVAAEADARSAQALMRGLLARTTDSPDAAYRTYQTAMLNEGCQQLAQLHAMATPAQRTAAVQALARYEGLAVSLASASD